jgi:hypothetical protein
MFRAVYTKNVYRKQVIIGQQMEHSSLWSPVSADPSDRTPLWAYGYERMTPLEEPERSRGPGLPHCLQFVAEVSSETSGHPCSPSPLRKPRVNPLPQRQKLFD